MSSVGLNFGMEMEYLLKPKPAMRDLLNHHGFNDTITPDSSDDKGKQANRGALRMALVDLLGARDIAAGLSTGEYDKWTVADEPSLDERPGFCTFTLLET